MCCRIRKILRRILSFYYSKEPTIYTKSFVYNPNNAKINWEATVPDGVVFIEKIEAVSLDERNVKYKVWNSGDRVRSMSLEDQMNVLNSRSSYPWLWIGGVSYYKSQDKTSAVDPYLVPGNKITLDLLNSIDGTISNWHYVDPVTFKEIEFPEDGITINASRMERTP
jgi:hypothetical protein